MRAEVIPNPAMPGHAVLRLHEVQVPRGEVTLLIERTHGSARFLSETGWQGNEAWLKPQRFERVGDTLDLHVGPRVCDIVAGSNVRITLRDRWGERGGATVAAWPAMQTSGAHDPDRRTSDVAVGTTGEEPATILRPPPPDPEPDPVATEPVVVEPVPPPQSEPTPPPPPPPEPAPPNRWAAAVVMLSGLFVLLTAGAGYWLFLLNGEIDEARQARQQAITERDACLRSCTPPPSSGRVDAAARALEEKLRTLDSEIERLRRR
jgi:hypothetical protein